MRVFPVRSPLWVATVWLAAVVAARAEPAPTISDPAFEAFVDLALAATALEARDASLLTDTALQLAEGERVLRRTHASGVTAKGLLGRAATLAADRQDKASLDRIARAAERLSDKDLAARLQGLQKLGGPSRAVDPALTVSLESLDAGALFAATSLAQAIRDAEQSGDAEALDAAEQELNGPTALAAPQKDALRRRLASARQAVQERAAADPDPVDAALGRMLAASRTGPPGTPQHGIRPIRSTEIEPNRRLSFHVEILVDGQPWPYLNASDRPPHTLGRITGSPQSVLSRQFASLGPIEEVRFPRYGTEYAIRITNLASRRAEFVVSVDGLSVMNRKPAGRGDRGYLLGPDRSYTILGWREDDRRVKSFTVTPPGESEAAKHGLAERAGVIEVTAFAEMAIERPRPWILNARATGIGISAKATHKSAGTGAGREQESKVVRVRFVRSGEGLALKIRYNVETDPTRLGLPK